MFRLAIILLLLTPLAGHSQQIYQTKDAQGNVVFTDQPPPGDNDAQPVELQRTNTAAPPVIRPLPPVAPEREQAPQIEYSIEILEPANETTIAMGPGNFAVKASASPALQPGQSLQLEIDGENNGPAQQSGVWNLTNVFRGAHDLTVSIVSADGDILTTSGATRVYVLRPSINFRN